MIFLFLFFDKPQSLAISHNFFVLFSTLHYFRVSCSLHVKLLNCRFFDFFSQFKFYFLHAGTDNNELETSSDNNVFNKGNNETNASSSTATDIEAPDAVVAVVAAKTADSKGD